MNLAERILKEFFPDNLNCVVCKKPVSRKNRYPICSLCMNRLKFIKHGCSICGKQIIHSNSDYENTKIGECAYCKGRKFLFDRNISILEYDEISAKIVFDFKYRRNTFLSKIIADLMVEVIYRNKSIDFMDFDFLTYVPLSKKRLKKRGFNQSKLIAERIGEIMGIPVVNSVDRIKDTKRLFGLDMRGRKKELNSAFCIDKKFSDLPIKNKIIIIDDIFTTGSTIDEISKILRLNGVEKIVSITFLTGRYNK